MPFPARPLHRHRSKGAASAHTDGEIPRHDSGSLSSCAKTRLRLLTKPAAGRRARRLAGTCPSLFSHRKEFAMTVIAGSGLRRSALALSAALGLVLVATFPAAADTKHKTALKWKNPGLHG